MILKNESITNIKQLHITINYYSKHNAQISQIVHNAQVYQTVSHVLSNDPTTLEDSKVTSHDQRSKNIKTACGITSKLNPERR